ncbi:MOSC domain-containing protein [Bacillus stercoris]|uniref:MOSC domain-containing protein n=1 Tax=Bacillus TaxID=1386 RepID=UPI000259787C|nr:MULTISPECIES: MOSC domain-containing protein [Bacillus]AFI27089.1 MOSC domain-containing protein [Bacillus sp. JS]MDO7347976.1 MOSC domain-containing protein [Bacillus stercoris]TII13941.1 MOSC domain-containing protein [Bacillus subtilis]BEV38886.1 MOSC domain-containing protein [Bacillus stercoris]
MNRQIIHLAVGKPKEYDWNHRKEMSAIGKSTVSSIELKKAGIVGDDVANHKFHGGADRAVCLYPFEHYVYWERMFNKKMTPPIFGENITATGMLEEQVCIGDVYRIGGTIIQVTQGRVPCATISKYNEERDFLKKVVETCLTGYFFRVLQEGTIESHSDIELVEKDPCDISVLSATQVLFHQKEDKKSIEQILEIDALAEDWRKRFLKLL